MTRSARALALALAGAALAGLAAPALAAQARIVPGRSIGQIAVGDERATIALRLGGDGVVIARTPNPQAPGNRNLDRVTVAYPARALTVRFPTDEASTGAGTVATRSARYRTAAGGIGVGSTRRALRRALSPACIGNVCRLFAGGGLTRFHLAGGRIVRVAVSQPPRAPQ